MFRKTLSVAFVRARYENFVVHKYIIFFVQNLNNTNDFSQSKSILMLTSHFTTYLPTLPNEKLGSIFFVIKNFSKNSNGISIN